MKSNTAKCAAKTAVAYARYSSAGQRDVSIDQQLQDIRAFAKREGYTIIHEYADHAKSGYRNSSARVEFQKMLKASSSGRFDTVIAWKVDRFGRNRRESAIYKGQLSDSGVNVVYAMEPIPAGSAGVLTEGMLEAIAEWYSRNLSENVIRGMRDNAAKALYNGSPIVGYLPGPDGKYQIEPDGASLVRWIFDRYLAGYSAGSIARDLNERGAKTAQGKDYSVNSILRIIGNRRYTGVYIWGDVEVPGGMPQIISAKDWEDAQAMRRKTGRHYENQPAEYLLTGKVFCGHCGKPLVGDSGKSKTGAMYHYYTCTGRKVKNGLKRTCDKRPIRREYLEKAVLDFIYERCLTGPECEKIADAIIEAQRETDASSPLSSFRAELRETEKKISNINDAIENGIWNASTSARLKALEEKAAKLKATIAEMELVKSQLLDRDRILFYLSQMARYDRDNPSRQKQLIATFINSVYVYDDRLKIVINAVEGNASLELSELPPDDDVFSDSVTNGLPTVPHSNTRVVVYTIAV